MELAFAVLTFILFIAGAVFGGYVLGGPIFATVAGLIAFGVVCWLLHRAYWPMIQDAIERAWRVIAHTGER